MRQVAYLFVNHGRATSCGIQASGHHWDSVGRKHQLIKLLGQAGLFLRARWLAFRTQLSPATAARQMSRGGLARKSAVIRHYGSDTYEIGLRIALGCASARASHQFFDCDFVFEVFSTQPDCVAAPEPSPPPKRLRLYDAYIVTKLFKQGIG